MERYLNWSSHVLWGEEDRKQGTQIGKEGRNSDKLRKRKALLRSREFAVVVGGGGGAAAACWVVVVVDETGKEKGIRRNRVWGRRNRVCGYGGYWLSGFCVYRVLEKFRGRLLCVFKNWKLLFKNICENTCGWKSILKCVKCCLKTENGCLKTQTKHSLNFSKTR